MTEFKVVIVGDGNVGKSTFVKRHITGEFDKQYKCTGGVEVSSTVFYTSRGPVRLNIWDTAGQEKLCPLREGYYIGANACIIMFDVGSRITYKNVPRWYKDLTRICKNIPIVILGNKVDIQERKVKYSQIKWPKQNNLQYYDISAQSNYQYEKPFLYILQRLLGDQFLYFVEAIALEPQQISMDEQHLQKLKQEMEEAENQQLPDNEEEF